MIAKIYYTKDKDLQLNKVTGYRLYKSEYANIPVEKNEILIQFDKLPERFTTVFRECSVDGDKVIWNPKLIKK